MSTKKNPVDADAILRLVSEARAALEAELSPEEREAMKSRVARDESSGVAYTIDESDDVMRDFDAIVAADALSDLAQEIRGTIDRKREEMYERVIDAFYVAEELARDPAHADLVKHVEAMRRAHESQYGKPIPPKRRH